MPKAGSGTCLRGAACFLPSGSATDVPWPRVAWGFPVQAAAWRSARAKRRMMRLAPLSGHSTRLRLTESLACLAHRDQLRNPCRQACGHVGRPRRSATGAIVIAGRPIVLDSEARIVLGGLAAHPRQVDLPGCPKWRICHHDAARQPVPVPSYSAMRKWGWWQDKSEPCGRPQTHRLPARLPRMADWRRSAACSRRLLVAMR